MVIRIQEEQGFASSCFGLMGETIVGDYAVYQDVLNDSSNDLNDLDDSGFVFCWSHILFLIRCNFFFKDGNNIPFLCNIAALRY